LSDYGERAHHNLTTISRMEGAVPGSAQRIYNEFGIRFFGRYPEKVLLEQLQPIKNGDHFALVGTNLNDHNGAFENSMQTYAISREAKNVGIKTVMFEYSNPSEFLDYWQQHAPKDPDTGEPEKAELVFVRQHGFNDGDREKIERTWKNFLGQGENRTPLLLAPGGLVVSAMCYGGAAGHPMDVIKQEYDTLTTMGAEEATSIQSLKMTRDPDGNLSAQIVYKKGKTVTYKDETT